MPEALVTGASGFIGSALTRRLLRDGYSVRALCRTPAKGKTLADAGAKIVQGDVNDLESMRRHSKSCDFVFHVAGEMSGKQLESYQTNVFGTLNTFRAAVEAGVQRFIHVSSIAVYGYYVDGAINEDCVHHPSPHDLYQMTKSAGEAAVWTQARLTGLPTVTIRPAFVYGPGSGLWSRQLYQLAHRIVPQVSHGQGNAHPIYIDDVVDLLVTVATHPDAPGNAFNVAPDPAPTWQEFMGYYMRMAGNDRTFELPVDLIRPAGHIIAALGHAMGRPIDVNGALYHMGHHATYSIARAKTLLNWRPRISLAQGMALTEPWLRSSSS